jgi:CRP-like cAMP-binding protein
MMLQIDNVISIIENANGIRLQEEKVKPVYEQMTCCKKDKNQIISRAGDVSNHLFVLLSGIIRLYYIDMDGNDVTRFFCTKGCISTEADRMPYAAEALESCDFLLLDRGTAKSLMGDDMYWIKIWNRLLQNSIRYKIYRESSF